MRLGRPFVLASLAAAAAFAACTLNPQPLPPSDGEATNSRGPDAGVDAGGKFQEPNTPPDELSDAGVGAADGDADADAGDADASDASDADAG